MREGTEGQQLRRADYREGNAREEAGVFLKTDEGETWGGEVESQGK